MQCPLCGQRREKKQWTKGQWTSYSAAANGYVGCRSCRDAGAHNIETPAHSPDASCALRQAAAGLATRLGHLIREVSLHPWASVHWDDFMSRWEADVARATRKDLSHHGVLASTLPWEPRHWSECVPTVVSSGVAQSTQWYYDAGNDVYAFSVKIVFPRATSTRGHNANYLGDVVEAILGICLICREQTGLATILGNASRYLYGIKALLSFDSFNCEEVQLAVLDFIDKHSQFQPQPPQQRAVPSVAQSTPDASMPDACFEDDERSLPASPRLQGLAHSSRLQ